MWPINGSFINSLLVFFFFCPFFVLSFSLLLPLSSFGCHGGGSTSSSDILGSKSLMEILQTFYLSLLLDFYCFFFNFTVSYFTEIFNFYEV